MKDKVKVQSPLIRFLQTVWPVGNVLRLDKRLWLVHGYRACGLIQGARANLEKEKRS